MQQASVNGVTLEYETAGDGESVVLIHGALIAVAFRPLLVEPALASRFRLVRYHRRGYLGSSIAPAGLTIRQQASDCQALLSHLGLTRAHVVGHSYGGAIALQLALDTPDLVHSLTLLETALLVGVSASSYQEAIARDRERYAGGDAAGTVDQFLQARFGSSYRDFLDRLLPGSFAQAVADAGTTFEVELPALLDWHFAQEEARHITQPVLAVLGEASSSLWPRFGEAHRQLMEWLPQAESCSLAGATHALQMQYPEAAAVAIAQFLARHPITAPA